jgi:hypothetical protein
VRFVRLLIVDCFESPNQHSTISNLSEHRSGYGIGPIEKENRDLFERLPPAVDGEVNAVARLVPICLPWHNRDTKRRLHTVPILNRQRITRSGPP